MPLRCSGVSVLTVACVPTGAKTGVMRSPCGVVKTPVRARLFLALMLNSNIGMIIIQDDEAAPPIPPIIDSVSKEFTHAEAVNWYVHPA